MKKPTKEECRLAANPDCLLGSNGKWGYAGFDGAGVSTYKNRVYRLVAERGRVAPLF